jgi:hypothetical protein
MRRKDMPSENLIFKMNFERELTELIDKYLRPDTSSLQWSLVNDVLDETLRKLDEEYHERFPSDPEAESEVDDKEFVRVCEEEDALKAKKEI